MRRHAKAPTAGPTKDEATGLGPNRVALLLAALAVTLMSLALAASLAGASKGVFDFFGSEGEGDGQFGSSPRAVAVNLTGVGGVEAGDVYVADPLNNRVQRFDAAGEYQAKFGASGSGAGQLSTPTGVAVDQTDGSVYVHDQDNRRVAKYSATGSFLFAFGAGVADGTTDELQTCTATCFAGLDSTVDGGFGATAAAPGLAVAPAGSPNAGDVIVADPGGESNRRIEQFEAPGASGPAVFVKEAGGSGTALGQFGFDSPTRVAVDDAGGVYAVDNGNNRVQVFTASLEAPAVFAEATLSGEPAPTNVAIDPGAASAGDASDDRVYVTKPCDSTACPPESLPPPFSTSEVRIKELETDGTPLDTHMAGAGITVVNGITKDTSGDRLYASSTSGGSRVYVIDEVEAPEVTIDPVTTFDATSATFEGEVDPNGTRTDYRFEYSSDGGATWTCIVKPNCAEAANLKDAGSGTAPVAVSDQTSALVPGTTYKVRLRAIKPFGAGTDSAETEFSAATSAPAVLPAYVAPRGTTTARLNGYVNPNNSATDIHFEYGTAGECASNPCASSATQSVGSDFFPEGLASKLVSADLSGLEPGTTYHYRLVATSTEGTSAGPDRIFETRTLAEATPPQRGIELINLPDKGTQHVRVRPLWAGGRPFAQDGDSAIWTGLGGIPGGTAGLESAFVAKRSADGWRSQSILPPADQLEGGGDFGFSVIAANPGFSEFLLRSGTFISSPPWGEVMRIDLDHHQERVLYLEDITTETVAHSQEDGSRMDTTADLDHAFTAGLTGEQVLDLGTSTPEIVSLMPDGSPAPCGVSKDDGFFNTESYINSQASGDHHWVARDDGSRVFFAAEASAPCEEVFPKLSLYVRNRESGVTTQVGEGVTKAIRFIRALDNGRTAYFVTPDPQTGDDSNAHSDVYRWVEGEGLTCMTCVVPDANLLEYGGQPTAVRVSDDGSHIYFESTSQLVPGHGTAGRVNLYVLSDGAIRFVAETRMDEGGLSEKSFVSNRGASLSHDGYVLLIRSQRPLTTDEISPECGSVTFSHPCEQLYRYDDRDGSLECISCRHGGITSGELGNGETSFTVGDQVSTLSANGRTVAFTSSTALLPADVNNSPDVYAWQEGTLRLVTDGVTEFPPGHGLPTVVGVDADGSNIFFTVAGGEWTGFEHDGLANFYTARVGGGFDPPAPPTHCDGDACQGPIEAPPAPGNSASATFHGNGNLTGGERKRCRKGALRRGGRCVSKRAAARRACRKKHGTAKRRCMGKQLRRLAPKPRRYSLEARALRDVRRTK